MAEVYSQNGFTFHIFPNDHVPSHVHVYKGGDKIVIDIGDEKTAPSFSKRKSRSRMRDSDAFRALRIVAEQQELLLKEWRERNG